MPQTTVSPSSRPLDSGTSRCQQASSSAHTLPSDWRYITTCLPQIVRGNSACLRSTSQAAAYQALSGKGDGMWLRSSIQANAVCIHSCENQCNISRNKVL